MDERSTDTAGDVVVVSERQDKTVIGSLSFAHGLKCPVLVVVHVFREVQRLRRSRIT
jgi:hypothetical protein